MFIQDQSTIKRLLSVISIISFTSLFAISCSTDSGGGVSLDGDLRYQVEGSEGETIYLSVNRYTESGGSFETIGEVTVSSSGTAEGDLQDGNYTGFQLQGSGQGGNEPNVTLKLLGDGDVLGEADEPNSNGIFMVEVGNIPNHNQ